MSAYVVILCACLGYVRGKNSICKFLFSQLNFDIHSVVGENDVNLLFRVDFRMKKQFLIFVLATLLQGKNTKPTAFLRPYYDD